MISQASHLLTFAISGVGHGGILQLGKRETLHFGPIGAGGPKMPSHFFPIEILGVDQLPIILQNSKSETPDLSDLCLDYEKEADFLFFCLLLSIGLKNLNGNGDDDDDDDDAKFKNPKAAVRRP